MLSKQRVGIRYENIFSIISLCEGCVISFIKLVLMCAVLNEGLHVPNWFSSALAMPAFVLMFYLIK